MKGIFYTIGNRRTRTVAALAITGCFFAGASTALAREYRHEVRGSVNYDTSDGQADSGESTTKIDQKTMVAELSYGYIVNDSVEPFFDFVYRNDTRKVGAVDSTGSVFDWGLGMLFNIPIGEAEITKNSKRDQSETPRMSYSTWIPYGGVVLASQRGSGAAPSSDTDVSENAIVTKLVFGTRYMLYPHIGLNFSMRVFYQNTESSADATTDEKGSMKKLTVQTNLVSMTLMF